MIFIASSFSSKEPLLHDQKGLSPLKLFASKKLYKEKPYSTKNYSFFLSLCKNYFLYIFPIQQNLRDKIMRFSIVLASAIFFISSASAAKLEKRCSLKREPMTFEDGLVCFLFFCIMLLYVTNQNTRIIQPIAKIKVGMFFYIG